MSTIKDKLSGIIILISWREIARKYFGKSSQWIYKKMESEYDSDNSETFSGEEMKTLKEALLDISEELRKVSEQLD